MIAAILIFLFQVFIVAVMVLLSRILERFTLQRDMYASLRDYIKWREGNYDGATFSRHEKELIERFEKVADNSDKEARRICPPIYDSITWLAQRVTDWRAKRATK